MCYGDVVDCYKYWMVVVYEFFVEVCSIFLIDFFWSGLYFWLVWEIYYGVFSNCRGCFNDDFDVIVDCGIFLWVCDI